MKKIFFSISMFALMLVSGANVYLANQYSEVESNLTLEDVEAEGGWWDELADWWYNHTPINDEKDQNGDEFHTGLPGTNWKEYTITVSCTSPLPFSEGYFKTLKYCGYGKGSCTMSEHC